MALPARPRMRGTVPAILAIALTLVLHLLPTSASDDPIIHEIKPPQAYANEWVTILGTGFGSSVGRVTFQGASGRLTAKTSDWSDASIRAQVPYLTYPGELLVRTADGRTSNGVHFTQPCWDKPVIKSIVPSSALQCEVVKITGCGFGDFQYEQVLTFNGVDATGSVIGNWTETELLVPVPDKATSGPVVVTNKRRVPSSGFPFKVLNDTTPWQLLPSIGESSYDFTMELNVRRTPADPRTPPDVVTRMWEHDESDRKLPVAWLAANEFEQTLKGASSMGRDSEFRISGQLRFDQEALVVRYEDKGRRIAFESTGDRKACDYRGQLEAVLPLGGWNAWAPWYYFGAGPDTLRDKITRIDFSETCWREDYDGNFLYAEESYELESVDWAGSTFGHPVNSLGHTFTGPGKDPCRDPHPVWTPDTDLAGDVYVKLPDPVWARTVLTLGGVWLGKGPFNPRLKPLPLPGVPVLLLQTREGASQPVEIGRTITDNGGTYRFFGVPIASGMQLELILEDHQTAPPGFVVTYRRADNAAADPVTWRSDEFETTSVRPTRRDVSFGPGTGTANVPDEDLDDVAATYAHTWQAWQTAASFGLPLEMHVVRNAPIEIRAFSPENGTNWRGDNVWGPTYGPVKWSDGRVWINIEAAKNGSTIDDPDRPANREYHEFGHHAMADMFEDAIAWYNNSQVTPGDNDTNHFGVLNPTTADAWAEGFAEYYGAVVARRAGASPRPELYPVGPTVINLDHNYKSWSRRGYRQMQPVAAAGPVPPALVPVPASSGQGYGEGFSAEEFAVAGLLWDLADGENDEHDLTPLAATQPLLDDWGIQLTDPLAAPCWPPKVYGDGINMGDAALLALIRDSQALSRKHALHEPLAPPGYDHIFDVKQLYDLLKAEGVGQGLGPVGTDGLTALDELFVAHGFFADTSPQNLVYDPGEAIGATSNKLYKVGQTTIPARAVRHSPAPPPGGHLSYDARDARTGAPVTVTDLAVDVVFDPPYAQYSYSYTAPADRTQRLVLVAPEPLYAGRIRVTAFGDLYQSTAPAELEADEYWRRLGHTSDGELLSHTFGMQRVSVGVFLPIAAVRSDVSPSQSVPTAVTTPLPAVDFNARVVELINAERGRMGLAGLTLQADLARAADWYATDMATHEYYYADHTDRLGRGTVDRLKDFNYTPEGYASWRVAENIARGQRTPEELVQDWMASPIHRANILDAAMCEIGTGHALAGGTGQVYWVADFGCRVARATSGTPATPGVTTSPSPTDTRIATPSATWTGAPTATGTPTVTPTTATPERPTPQVTLTPGHGIQGQVTYSGAPVEGLYLSLVHVVGGTHTEQYMAQTWIGGYYAFATADSLAAGEEYYVQYHNEAGDDRFVSWWYGPRITSYRAGEDVAGGDFDIENVSLLAPAHDSTVSLPARFEWQPRSAASDNYQWIMYDQPAGVRWSSGDLGTAASYTLRTLPEGASYGQDYYWYVRVYDGSGGYGISRYMRLFRVAEQEILYWDDFCDSSTAWASGDDEVARYGYRSDGCGYEIEIKQPQRNLAVSNGPSVSGDYDVALLGHPDGQGLSGLLFGATPWTDFYLYALTTDGRYGLLRYDAASWTTLVPFTPADRINPGVDNAIWASIRGDDIELYLDAELLATAADGRSHDGYYGLFAESVAAGFVGHFSMFSVRRPKAAALAQAGPADWLPGVGRTASWLAPRQ